jgi:hypothetical protein
VRLDVNQTWHVSGKIFIELPANGCAFRQTKIRMPIGRLVSTAFGQAKTEQVVRC